MRFSFLTIAFLTLCLCIPAFAQGGADVSAGLGVDSQDGQATFNVAADYRFTGNHPLSFRFRGVYGNSLADTVGGFSYDLQKLGTVVSVYAGLGCVDRADARCHPVVGLGARWSRFTGYGHWYTPIQQRGRVVREFRTGIEADVPLVSGIVSKDGKYSFVSTFDAIFDKSTRNNSSITGTTVRAGLALRWHSK